MNGSPYRRILVPVGAEGGSSATLSRAVEVAGAFGADLVLLHVCHVPAITVDAPGVVPDMVSACVQQGERILARALDAVRERYHAVTGVLRTGPAEEQICWVARHYAIDLVVMTAPGRGLAQRLGWSVPRELACLSTVPILLVPREVPAGERKREPATTAGAGGSG